MRTTAPANRTKLATAITFRKICGIQLAIQALLASLLIAEFFAVRTRAQGQSRASFDAASIRERNSQDGDAMIVGVRATPGRLTDECATLKSLIFYAYDFSWFAPIEGLPSWGEMPCGRALYPNRYVFQATMPTDTTQDESRQMMQTLLADRFKLAVHWQKKNMPIYALVIAKGGFKGKPYNPSTDPPIYGNSILPCPQEDRACHALPLSPGPISQLAAALMSPLERTVIDSTGLRGVYDLRLKWAGDTSADSPLPSLPSALRETFGLELKSESGPVDVLVIDHVEKPTPN